MFIVCSVFDEKAEEFGTLFIARTPGAASRLFADAINGGKDTQISEHPEDFFLAQVGTFDETTGQIYPLDIPDSFLLLMKADQVLAPNEEG